MMTENPIGQKARRESPAGKGHRLWMPLFIGVLALAAVVGIRLKPDLERNFASFAVFAVLALALLLELIWFLFLSRFQWRLRLAAAGVIALGIFALTKVLRVDGTVNGTGLPNLVWRWTPPRAPLPVAPSRRTKASLPRRQRRSSRRMFPNFSDPIVTG